MKETNTARTLKIPVEIQTTWETQTNSTNTLLKEIVEQLKLMNNTLEEIHDEIHELTNRGSY